MKLMPSIPCFFASTREPAFFQFAIFLLIGFFLTFFFVWLGRVNTRIWFYRKYQRPLGFSPKLLADQVYVPDWVAVGFWPLGASILAISALAMIGGISLASLSSSEESALFKVLNGVLILSFLPGVLYVFAIVIKFFYNMLVHGAAMRDDAETAKAETAEKERRIAALKAALASEPHVFPLNHHRRYWLACLGDDPAGHYLDLLSDDSTGPLLCKAVLKDCGQLPGDKAFHEKVAALAKRRGLG